MTKPSVSALPPRRGVATPDECQAFLDANPNIQFFDVFFTCMAGVPRGKRLRRHELMPIYE